MTLSQSWRGNGGDKPWTEVSPPSERMTLQLHLRQAGTELLMLQANLADASIDEEKTKNEAAKIAKKILSKLNLPSEDL